MAERKRRLLLQPLLTAGFIEAMMGGVTGSLPQIKEVNTSYCGSRISAGKKVKKKAKNFLAGTKELLPLSPRKKGNKSYGRKKEGLKPGSEVCRLHRKDRR